MPVLRREAEVSRLPGVWEQRLVQSKFHPDRGTQWDPVSAKKRKKEGFVLCNRTGIFLFLGSEPWAPCWPCFSGLCIRMLCRTCNHPTPSSTCAEGRSVSSDWCLFQLGHWFQEFPNSPPSLSLPLVNYFTFVKCPSNHVPLRKY